MTCIFTATIFFQYEIKFLVEKILAEYMKLKDSELILNPDGSIYHLNLHPEQIAPIIITVGDQDRVARVSRYFDRIEHRVRKREFSTHTGWLGKHRLTVLSTGIGADNVDIAINELDALANIDLSTRQIRDQPTALTLIRIGTTGGLQAEIPLDSFVASTVGIGLDGLLHFYQAPSMQNHPLIDELRRHFAGQWDFPLSPYYAESDAALIGRFSNGFYQGYTATNPGFYGPQGRQLRAPVQLPQYLDLLQKFNYQGNQILNLEMETAALLGLSKLLGHRAVSLSAVIANRPRQKFSANASKTVQNLIELALEKITA